MIVTVVSPQKADYRVQRRLNGKTKYQKFFEKLLN